MLNPRKRALFGLPCIRLRRRGLCWTLALSLVVVNSLLVAAEPATRTVAEATPAQRLLAAARQMVGDFKVTRYSHKTLIDRTRGICEVDCSGFIVALLRQTSRGHLRQIATTHKRPLAEDFYQAFAPTNGETPRGWAPIKRLPDAEPGDLIAWIKRDHEPGDNTGHVVLVEEKPTAESPNQFRVRVLDSTAHGHGSDSRPEGKSGIGRGTIWLDVGADGRPIGFRWKSRTGRLHEVPIAIGRAVELGK
jgi:hypothetical protein